MGNGGGLFLSFWSRKSKHGNLGRVRISLSRGRGAWMSNIVQAGLGFYLHYEGKARDVKKEVSEQSETWKTGTFCSEEEGAVGKQSIVLGMALI